MRRSYDLKCDDAGRLGGEITLDRWPEGVRILILGSAFGGHRANLIMSPSEARRLAKQLVNMATQNVRR